MPNIFEDIERTTWNEIKRFAGGGLAATYRQGETETPIFVLPIDPTPDSFGFEDFRIYKTSRIFETEKAALNGIVPKENDVLVVNGIEHAVKKLQSGPCWVDVGSYGVTIKIHTSIFR